MLERRLIAVAMLASLIAAPACEKKGALGPDKQMPTELQPTKASFDASKLVAPALFANIPADTPYVLAAFEAVPLEYYAKLKKGFGPAFSKFIQKERAEEGSSTPDPFEIILGELGGVDAKSFEALGISAQPRFAVYGLGAAPVVLRLEIKDEAALRATIDRVAKKMNETLSPQESKDGRAYWRIVDDELTVIIAILDKQFIASIGPSPAVDAKLDLILGIQKPAQNMGDGKALIEVMTKHGFGPQLVGYVDTRKLATQGLALSAQQPPAACGPALDQLALKVPRIAIGYTEISGKRASGGMVVELEPTLLAEVAALRTEVPGLGSALSDSPLMAMGGGVDFAKGAALLSRVAGAMRATGEACQIPEMVEETSELVDTLSRPLPRPLAAVTGFAGAVHSFEMSSSGIKKLDGFGMVTATSAKELLDSVKNLVPLDQIGLTTDGKLNKLAVPASVLPEELVGGVGDKAIVVGTGPKGRALAERGLHGTAAGKSPFFVGTYDYGRFFEIQAQMASMGNTDPVELELTKSMGSVFGRANFSIDVNDKGVVMWGAFDLK